MGKTIIINNSTYSDVEYVKSPLAAGGGDATFWDTSGATAEAGDVTAGKTFFKDGGAATGSLPSNGDVSADISTASQEVTIPAGRTSGGIVKIAAAEMAKIISANIKAGITLLGIHGKSSVVDTEISEDAAAASNIQTGKKAYVNGSLVIGTHTDVVITYDSVTKALSIS